MQRRYIKTTADGPDMRMYIVHRQQMERICQRLQRFGLPTAKFGIYYQIFIHAKIAKIAVCLPQLRFVRPCSQDASKMQIRLSLIRLHLYKLLDCQSGAAGADLAQEIPQIFRHGEHIGHFGHR